MNSLITRSQTALRACPRVGILSRGALSSLRTRQQILRPSRFTSLPIRFNSQLAPEDDPFQALSETSNVEEKNKKDSKRTARSTQGQESWEQNQPRRQQHENKLAQRSSTTRSQQRDVVMVGEPRSLLTLAIETSCDDTCVAILEKKGEAARIRFNKIITSNSSEYRGIHPVVAVQSHDQNLASLIEEAKTKLPPLNTANDGTPRVPDFITVTRGPGMNKSLQIGIDAAKNLATTWGIPILGVHHMQAHALTPRLVDALSKPWPAAGRYAVGGQRPEPAYPFLTLLASGGHTQLVLSTGLTSHTVVIDTQDISVGDLLDKCARAILPKKILADLGTGSYGAALEKYAFPDAENIPDYDYEGYKPPAKREEEISPWISEERGWRVPAPLAGTRELKYNFTGLGGVIRGYASTLSEYDLSGRQTLARVVMKLAFEHIVGRILMVLEQYNLTKYGTPKKGIPAPWSPGYAEYQEQLLQKLQRRKINQQNSKKRRRAAKRAAEISDDDDYNTTLATTTSINTVEFPNQPYINPLTIPRAPSQPATPDSFSQNDNKIKLILSGGVASNKYLRHILREWLNARNFSYIRAVAPPLEYCTDNAAMIAWTGMEMFEAGFRTPLDEKFTSTRRWSLDPAVSPTKIGTLAREEYGVGLMEERFFVREQVEEKETEKKRRVPGAGGFDELCKEIGVNLN